MGLSSYSRHCFLSRRSLIRGYLVIYSGKRERREGSEGGNFAFPWPFRSALVSNIRTTMKTPAVFLHAPLPRHYAVLFSLVCGLFLLRVVSWFPYSLFHQRWHSHLQKLDEPLYLPILRRKVSHTLHKPKTKSSVHSARKYSNHHLSMYSFEKLSPWRRNRSWQRRSDLVGFHATFCAPILQHGNF